VVPAFQDLAKTVDNIDTAQLSKALNVLSSDFSDTAPNVQSALTGLSRLSQTIASRDQQLQELLGHARGVTGVLAGRDQELQKLLVDTDQVMQVLSARRQVISDLLKNTSTLAQQLTGLVADNRATINPALSHLKTVIDTLNANQASIYRTLQLAGPFVRIFTDTIGNGKWFDNYVANLGPFAAQVKLPASLLSASPTTSLLGGK
jgi:phospholipid/cholesterol/gamma-HCH transport system substrate-binding protein